MDRIQVATNLSGPVHRETLEGREYVVVPAVLVKSKVLSNNLGRTFLPAEDVTPAWAEVANHAPAVADHPRTSARTPEVLNSLGVGRIYRVRAQDGALKADVFLDPSRANAVEDLTAILAKLEKGEKVEVSTGFPVEIEETSGVWNGQEYDRVIHPVGFDHLAVFAEQIGACSVEDGCGLAANREDGCGCGSGDLPDPPASAEAAAQSSGWRAFLQKAARLIGFRPADNQSDEDRRQLLRSALVERFGADDRHLWVDSVFSEDGVVVFEVESRNGGDSGLFRTQFEISEEGAVTLGEPEEVRRVTTFEPVANAADTPNPEEGNTMNREQMIAHLAEAGTDKDALAKLSDCDLKALSDARIEDAAQNTEPEGDSVAWQKAREWREKFEALDAETKNARELEEKERGDLLDDLLYNSRELPWSETEIRAMDIVQLRKVHRAVLPRRADYSGRGAPAGNMGSFDFVTSIMDGPAGTSVLDKKEAH